jgi:hypothetical protein
MTAYLCRSRACNMPGTHREGVDPEDCGPDCRGCGQAEAADGLQLCRVCERRIGHDAWRAAWLYEALSAALTGGQGVDGATGAAAREPGLSLRDPAVEARDTIRNLLVGLVRMISDERGISLPWRWEYRIERLPRRFIGPPRRLARRRYDNTVQAMAAYVGRHATWLAAHAAAGEHAEQLRDVALDGRTYALAFPGGRGGRQLLGSCPLPAPDDMIKACAAPVYATAGTTTIACRGCGHTATLEGWYRLLVGELPPPTGPVSAIEGAWRLTAFWGFEVTPESVRKWGQRTDRTGVAPARWVSLTRGVRGPLRRDERGRALYRWEDLDSYARRLWASSPETTRKDHAA